MLIADLHIHSHYSRATSRDCDAPHLDYWARHKGIGLIGTGDFTHPAWRKELAEALAPAEDGLYRLKEEHRLPSRISVGMPDPRFVISGEISTIYKKNGKTRKVHHVILLPSLEAAETLSHKLEAIGNLHSDGRPILGLDSHDLLEITLDTCPDAIYIPAHIWTPHFSLFGAFSGFDTLQECYEDLSSHVRAVETGLSSDPPMIRRVSGLDGMTLVSNSDAHSPSKLGREANLLDIPLSYTALSRAIQTGQGFGGTLEFFPEEGKYHLDGHRNCDVCLEPAETIRLGGLCPVCGKKITIGVQHRIEELADRPESFAFPDAKPFESLMPLPEVIASSLGCGAASKKVQERYSSMLSALGNELSILRQLSISDIESAAGFAIAEGIRRLRAGKVDRRAGFDGEYGVISLFKPGELEILSGQMAMPGLVNSVAKKAKTTPKQNSLKEPENTASDLLLTNALNPEQLAAVTAKEAAVAVIAGPGTGKTKTLVERIAHLIEKRGIPPTHITAVTFTNQAAAEMRARLEARLGKKGCKGLTVGTFHAICLNLLDAKPLLGENEAFELIREILAAQASTLSPLACLRNISAVKNGQTLTEASREIHDAYLARTAELHVRDLDDLLLDALSLDPAGQAQFSHLLVDEFQDVGPVQRQLIQHWSREGESLFVIGDPDQSIYGFRGADAACFDQLAARLPNLRVISLKQNYRSTPQILESALAVIDHNPGPPRRLAPNQPAGEPIRLMSAEKDFGESVWIAKEIIRMVGGVDMLGAASTGKHRHASRSFSDIAVLCRTRRGLSLVENALRHDSIPCVIFGREDFLSDHTVLAALGFFSSLLNPMDTPSLQNTLRLAFRVPSPLIQRAQTLLGAMRSLDLPLLHQELDSYEVLGPWLSAMDAFAPLAEREHPRKLLERWAELHGKSAPMEHLMNTSVFHDSMPSFLRALLTGQEADVRRAVGGRYVTDAVRLMTFHGSKGLEFPVVFLMSDGFASNLEEDSAAKQAEERRLFFVGMTRAREELIVTAGEAPVFFTEEMGIDIKREKIKLWKEQPKTEQMRLC